MATQATLYIELMVNIQILSFVLFFFSQPLFDTTMQTLGSGGRGDSLGNTDSEYRVVSVSCP